MKLVYILLGCVCLALGSVGAVLPILPTTPFLMVSAFCFARSSRRLNDWFRTTKLYKQYLESYVQGKGMTRRTKLRVLTLVTLLMGLGFVMMHRVPAGQMILAAVWAFHLLYFCFGVRTLKPEQAPEDGAPQPKPEE